MNGANLPLNIAPMGHVERIAHDAQAHPELQQAAAQQAAGEALRKARSQVQKTSKTEGGSIDPDADKNQGPPEHEPEPRREARSAEAEEPHLGQPWAGNLLNVKI